MLGYNRRVATTRKTTASKPAAVRFVLDRSLTDLAYRCYPDGCPRDRTCCIGLTVEVSRREVRAIDTLMDELARLVPGLRTGTGEYESVFVEDAPDLLIESSDDGVCPFLFRTRRHSLCSIHHLALRTGRAVETFKPAACRHWPLRLEKRGERIHVTVEPLARQIGCVAPRSELPGSPLVRDAFRSELAELCGDAMPRARR
jgi:hypothetical protein